MSGDRIPDYKAITIRNVVDTSSGNVLLAGLDAAHMTEVTLDGVRVDGITPEQVHGRFATVTLGPGGTNLNFSKTEIKVVPSKAASQSQGPYSCDGRFVPMQ